MEWASKGKIIVSHENENYIMSTIKYTKRLPNRISNKTQKFSVMIYKSVNICAYKTKNKGDLSFGI